MKTKILSIAFIAALLFSTSVFAQQPQPQNQWSKNGPDRRAMMMKKRQAMQQKAKHEAFFTEEQKEAMKALRIETVKQVKPLKNELSELAAHQKTLTTADKADLKAINKNIDKMSDVKAEIAKIMAAQHQKVRSLLTEEQLLKFDMMRQHHGQKGKDNFRQQRKQRGGKPGFSRGA